MKVEELINRCLCRDDTLPRKIIYKGKEFTLETNIPFPHFYNTDKGVNFMSVIEYFQDLEEEVEIVEVLEEDKEIEKIKTHQEYTSKGKLHDYLYYQDNKYALSLPQKILTDTINKLIDEINELKKGK
jgi:hypothetical protein